MKKVFFITLLIFASLAGIYAMNQKTYSTTPQDRSAIEKLWKDFDASLKADRPQKQMEILEQIKKMASEQRLPWDFYRACDEYRSTGTYRDWKKSDYYYQQFQKEIKEFSEPVVTFFNDHSVALMKDFLKENRAVLEAGRNSEFYSRDYYLSWSDFSPVLVENIENDYQYVLWSLVMDSMASHKENSEMKALLEEAIDGKYPAAALLELAPVLKMSDRFRQKESLEKYADKYKGKGVALIARQELLSMALRDLDNDSKSTSAQFKALREECAAFEKDRKALASSERSISEFCTRVDDIIRNSLDSKDIFYDIKNDIITVRTKNLGKVDISLMDHDRTVFSKTLVNNVRSYYVLDTLTCKLPAMNDGNFTVSFQYDGQRQTTFYNRYSIAIASRPDAEGTAIFLADALTGEPVSNADLTLSDRKERITTEYKGFKLNGFTNLPAEFARHLAKDSRDNILQCSYKDKDGFIHKTGKVNLNNKVQVNYQRNEETYIHIFPDRTAFNPDETVHFKVVAYHGDRTESLKTLEKGKVLTARLLDTEGDEISTLELKTNEFGSASGEFVLERRARNGNYVLNVSCGKGYTTGVLLRVDDFVLPTFDLTFDDNDQLYFPGDDVEISGTLKSYSGHSLSAADVHYQVNGNGTVIKEGKLELDSDGHFTIPFKAEGNRDYLYFNIEVKVTDTTGETLSWNKGITAYKEIPFDLTLYNKADAKLTTPGDPYIRPSGRNYNGVVSDDMFNIGIHTENEASRATLKIEYKLSFGDEVIAEGSCTPGEILELSTAGYPSGKYVFEATASDRDAYGNTVTAEARYNIYKINDGDNLLNFDAKCVFKTVKGERPAVQIGSSMGPVWACVELFGEGNKLYSSKLVHLEGRKGVKGSLTTVSFDWPDGQEQLILKVIFFKDYTQFSFQSDFSREINKLELPLSFTRFEDRTLPASPYTFEISTLPGVECTATIFDKSTESINRNLWNKVYLFPRGRVSVYYSTNAGENGNDDIVRPVAYARTMSKSAAPMVENALAGSVDGILGLEVMDYVEDVEDEVVEEAIPFQLAGAGTGEPITVRENFANTIAFEPFLRSDETGKISLNFTTADKLSTYYVQLFAHDKDMNSNVLRREMMVTIPVKVSVVEPQFLYTGDKYIVKASLASSVEKPASGCLKADFFDGKDYKSSEPVKTLVQKVELGALESLSREFEIDVPSVKELGILLTFIADGESSGSDAVFVSVPVFQAVQTITEAHSSLLRNGESLEAILASLKSQFVNTSADGAEMKDISILQMVRDAIPSKVEAESDNVIALSEALYIRLLARKLGSDINVSVSDEELVKKVLSCVQADGGIAWFEDMGSSPVVTATVLQRYASLRKRGIINPQTCAVPVQTVENAVKYLDKTYFGDRKRPAWCGGLSWEQYVSIRAMFPEVEFSAQGTDSKVLKEFRKDMKEYLTPKKERGLNGYILGKARRMAVLLELSASDEGRNLAGSWGITLGARSKLLKSLNKDLLSIEEYAIEHKSGGWYYPNAVMPFRGLLESEAFAHSFIADLLTECQTALRNVADETSLKKAGEIAEGIRVWLMVQKETQKWEEDAAFVNAISTVLDGSDDVLNLRVISLSKTITKPLADIKASGNGFTIERKFFLETTENSKIKRMELTGGETLAVGDRIIAEYRIWNEENRSFVKITAPRMASLRPVNQLSGHYGWWMKPLMVDNWYSVTPHGYRSVLKDRTEFWFDSYPEETTEITEEFYVTQVGTFQMAAMEIESLYAPHYRANGDGHAPVTSK